MTPNRDAEPVNNSAVVGCGWVVETRHALSLRMHRFARVEHLSSGMGESTKPATDQVPRTTTTDSEASMYLITPFCWGAKVKYSP